MKQETLDHLIGEYVLTEAAVFSTGKPVFEVIELPKGATVKVLDNDDAEGKVLIDLGAYQQWYYATWLKGMEKVA